MLLVALGGLPAIVIVIETVFFVRYFLHPHDQMMKYVVLVVIIISFSFPFALAALTDEDEDFLITLFFEAALDKSTLGMVEDEGLTVDEAGFLEGTSTNGAGGTRALERRADAGEDVEDFRLRVDARSGLLGEEGGGEEEFSRSRICLVVDGLGVHSR
ncbi:hypothetical protein MPER_01267 [Moniliophthora perniciosa FA553]|nr:hypothetical protein MPER_01267 [Moniliophthora perniciosa FA553]